MAAEVQKKNSLLNVIGMLGDLDTNLDILTKETFEVDHEEPLTDLITNFQGLQNTFTLLEDSNLVPVTEDFEDIVVEAEETPNVFSGTGKIFVLTYIDVIILMSIILGLFFILFVSCILFNYFVRRHSRKGSWRDLSQSETDSSVSWVSINTTNTEDTPVKSPATVKTVKLSPICSAQFLLESQDDQWCRTEISPSVLV